MVVFSVHPVTVLNNAFCMTCSLGMLVEDAGRGILQRRSHNCFVGSHDCLLLLHHVTVSALMICRGLCACTEMLWMCVMYATFWSKVRPRTLGHVAMGSVFLFIVRLVYSAASGVNRVQAFFWI